MSYKDISSNQLSKRGKSHVSNKPNNRFNNGGQLDIFRNEPLSVLNDFDSLSKNMFKHFEESFGFPSRSNMMEPFGLMRDGFDLSKLHNNMDEFEDSNSTSDHK